MAGVGGESGILPSTVPKLKKIENSCLLSGTPCYNYSILIDTDQKQIVEKFCFDINTTMNFSTLSLSLSYWLSSLGHSLGYTDGLKM